MKVLEFEDLLEFIDNRGYVHSTTMSRIIWQKVGSRIDADTSVVMDARFHRETNCACRFEVYDEFEKFSEECAPVAEFKLSWNEGQSSYIFLFEVDEKPVTRRIKASITIDNMKQDARFAGSCNIAVNDTMALVSNVVEANKRVHLAAYPGARDLKVVNLYMKKFPISLQTDDEKLSRLEIENIGERSHKDSVATLNRLHFPGLSLQPFEIAFLVQGSGVVQ